MINRSLLRATAATLRKLADRIEPAPLELQKGDRVLYRRRRWLHDPHLPEELALIHRIGSTLDEEIEVTGVLRSDTQKCIAYIEDDGGKLVAVSPARILKKLN